MGRVHVGDIFAHIAQELRVRSDAIPDPYSVEQFLTRCSFKLRLSVTDDLESTELDYLERYGSGRTFYFSLVDYDHGKTLAAGIYHTLLGSAPDMSKHTGRQFAPDTRLYLFLHISNIVPSIEDRIAAEPAVSIGAQDL